MFDIRSCIGNHSMRNIYPNATRVKSTYAAGQNLSRVNFETISSQNYLLCDNYCTLGVVNNLIRCTS